MPVFTRALVGGGTLLRRFWRGSKPKLFGLAFIAVVVGLVGLSIAFYNKTFTKVDMVTLKADRIGRQLDDHADVKIRGLIIGEVRSTSTTDTGASLKLAINPADMEYLPANVKARILPKTLFGEKFVDLVVPNDTDGTLEAVTDHIKKGAVIPQDQSKTAIELATVFDDLVPVLTAVKPQDLATTLNEVADALQGQGNALGASLVRTDTYLKGLNPALPQLNSDISKLADLADNLNNAAPQVFRMLDVASKLSVQDVVPEHKALLTFLSNTVGVSGEIDKILQTNEANAIKLGDVAAPTLETLRTSGQELAYIFQGETALTPRINAALGGEGPYLHINLTLKADRGAYTLPADCPKYETGGGSTSARALGPNCDGYVKGAPNGEVVVGSPNDRGNVQTKANGTQPASDTSTAPSTTAQPASYTTDRAARITPGTQAEQTEIAALVAPSSGLSASQVPGIADLLFAPQMRGTTVSQS